METEVELTTVSVNRVPIETLEYLKPAAIRGGANDSYSGVMKWCLLRVEAQQKASEALKTPGGLRAPDGA